MPDKLYLLFTMQLLDGRFAPAGAATRVAVFREDHFQGFAATEIFCATELVTMFSKTPFQVCGDPGIQGVIITANDVDRPVHRISRVPAPD